MSFLLEIINDLCRTYHLNWIINCNAILYRYVHTFERSIIKFDSNS